MTDEKIIEVMENMKFHADRADDKELMDACDGAIKIIRDNAKLKEAVEKIKEEIKKASIFTINSKQTRIFLAIEVEEVMQIIDKHTEELI